MNLYFGDILPYVPALLQALWVSVYVTLVGMLGGALFGVLLYLGKTSGVAPIRWFCTAYVEVFRNTPLLVQLYLIYFGSPQLGINLDPTWSALIGLTLNNAAYCAEIYRAGFQSVPMGLKEAGRALGLGGSQILRYVEFLPATKSVFPALTNQFILLFLASSIGTVIGLPDLMTEILDINSQTNRAIEVLTIGGLIYYLTAALIASTSRWSEKRIFAWGGETR